MMIQYLCECNRHYAIFMSHEKLARIAGLNDRMIEEAKQEDKKDEDALELHKTVSGVWGLDFVNASSLEALQCSCGHVIDLYRLFIKKHK